MGDMVHVLLRLDAKLFGSRITPAPPEAECGDGVAESAEQTATTLDLFNRARAVSTAMNVKILNPTWDAPQSRLRFGRTSPRSALPRRTPSEHLRCDISNVISIAIADVLTDSDAYNFPQLSASRYGVSGETSCRAVLMYSEGPEVR
ncbi:hypothetical protein [Streptomyces ipomoeae]|uniref:hypothetical protein n=1 Tax=Streptomyces ipomoeae TaxID=103232 RepID=UPI00215BEA26|nr:hypothetical protein [Streptomyces ipomoeae]